MMSFQIFIEFLQELFKGTVNVKSFDVTGDMPNENFVFDFTFKHKGLNKKEDHPKITESFLGVLKDPSSVIEEEKISDKENSVCYLKIRKKKDSYFSGSFASVFADFKKEQIVLCSEDGQKSVLIGTSFIFYNLLAQNPNHIFSRAEILNTTGQDPIKFQAMLQRIRLQFSQKNIPFPIKNVHGKGYCWVGNTELS